MVCAAQLWHCGHTWYPGTNVPEKIRGWYDMVDGAGFLLIETGDPQEINDFLMPYMDLMAWDVRALNELQYDQAIEQFRQAAGR